MELPLVLSAMRRNKVGAALIAVQIAVTLAILCNAVYIIEQYVAQMSRPSGVDETDVFTIWNQWIGNPPDLSSRIQADTAALRAIPGVADAYASNLQPLDTTQVDLGITLDPDRPDTMKFAAIYSADERAADTLRFRLASGRYFAAPEIIDCLAGIPSHPPVGILVTRALAQQLAPGGRVLGRIATLLPISVNTPIIGIVDRLEAPNVAASGRMPSAENSIVLPCREVGSAAVYVVRARPGWLANAMKTAPSALASVSRQRVILKVQSLLEARRKIYRADRTICVMLTLVCVILLGVTASGIIGLTSYWVSQRRRPVGIRRALGATRLDIVLYFQAENLLITAVGVAVGAGLTLAGNLWIVESFAMGRLPLDDLFVGIIAILLLGQLAVTWPALRAALVPPATAARGA